LVPFGSEDAGVCDCVEGTLGGVDSHLLELAVGEYAHKCYH